MGRVLSLHLGSNSGLPKNRVEYLSLRAGFGAEGDRHAGRDPDRAILIAGYRSYKLARSAGIDLPPGALGENMLIDLDPHSLLGRRVFVGRALLELVAVCTVCDSLSQFDLKLPKLLYQGRGVYARVLRGGMVRHGQQLGLLPPHTLRTRAQLSDMVKR